MSGAAFVWSAAANDLASCTGHGETFSCWSAEAGPSINRSLVPTYAMPTGREVSGRYSNHADQEKRIRTVFQLELSRSPSPKPQNPADECKDDSRLRS